MIDLVIASRELAGRILNNPNRKVDFLVSIGDVGSSPPSGYYRLNFKRRLRLLFNDVKEQKELYSFNKEHITRILTFTTDSIWPAAVNDCTVPTVLVHCDAGISRSPAVSQIILQQLGATAEEARAEVLRIRPQAIPNSYVLNMYHSLCF